MKNKFALFATILILSQSCFSPTNSTQTKGEDLNLLLQYLDDHQHTVIEVDENATAEVVTIQDFIKMQTAFDAQENQFVDTLLKFSGFESFERLVSAPYNRDKKIIRLLKFDFAFGNRAIEIFQVIERDKKDEFEAMIRHIQFAGDCNFPTISFGQSYRPFGSDCFSLVLKTEKPIHKKDWKSLINLIDDTSLTQTAYFSKEGLICDGYYYELYYYNGYPMDDINSYRWEMSCPGPESAIFKVSEKLIDLIKQ